MTQPIAKIDRDSSLGAYEVAIATDDERHDSFIIHFFDDGRTTVRRWTYEELVAELSEAVFKAIGEAAPRLG